jgi:predicted RNA-binding protein associated with RNAse of E/G family
MSEDIIVIKRNIEGKETWRYSGRVLEKKANFLRIEAFFNRPDTPFHGIVLANGDRFIETYYVDRWYNVFEIHDQMTGELKGWYCNVTAPPTFEPGFISYVDLALDLLVFPDMRQIVLDEDEFASLALDEATRLQALQAMEELKILFKK